MIEIEERINSLTTMLYSDLDNLERHRQIYIAAFRDENFRDAPTSMLDVVGRINRTVARIQELEILLRELQKKER
jgi:hypothetical protein